ncbi:uncharacterized protein LOC124453250 [Xenia sp. Carnegie-2017]|uniref:uncharacterized protein LOC124453250 n=1 Tax=Xenia sp. Carnegie-2017 TaxID=2897299 RepID=UPI001F03F3FB|nr:uncharacterized protein LOC124453250 [Xenia sp. Carnegie-2017]
MAHSVQNNSEGFVSWEKLRGAWIYSAFQVSQQKGTLVKGFLNQFVKNNPGYRFTIAQLYDELFHICITPEQSLEIQRTIKRRYGLDLEEGCIYELFPGAKAEKKRFRDFNDFRHFQQNDLVRKNRPTIERKHNEAKVHFTRVQTAFNGRAGKSFLSFDIEVYEHDHSQLLEIGYVIVHFTDAKTNQYKMSCEHLIIEENLHFKNKDYVPDNRNGFRFGTSKTLPESEAARRFAKDVGEATYILGHSVQHDTEYLKNIGVDHIALGKEMFDTQVINIYKESLKDRDNFRTRGLNQLMKENKIEYREEDLHNAGCDAFYTMMLFLRQMNFTEEQVNAIIMSF